MVLGNGCNWESNKGDESKAARERREETTGTATGAADAPQVRAYDIAASEKCSACFFNLMV